MGRTLRTGRLSPGPLNLPVSPGLLDLLVSPGPLNLLGGQLRGPRFR
ncbi:hypothetical protein [Nonomuraea sp. NPDC049758]